jgi:hypothetical protein
MRKGVPRQMVVQCNVQASRVLCPRIPQRDLPSSRDTKTSERAPILRPKESGLDARPCARLVALHTTGALSGERNFRTKMFGSTVWIRVTIHGSETPNQVGVFLFCDVISLSERRSEQKRLVCQRSCHLEGISSVIRGTPNIKKS